MFASAWLRVNLEGDGGPVAFAMRPDRKEAPIGVERSAGGEVGYQGVKVSGATKRSYDRQEAEVLAFNRGRTDPAWELKPSTGRALEAGQDLLLIVRAAKGSNGHGRVSFGAQVEWEEGGVLRRRRQEVTWTGDEAAFEIGA